MENPKEKAEEIFRTMLNAGRGMTSDYLAGECAMIAVEYMIEIDESDYSRKVKKALKKLMNHK